MKNQRVRKTISLPASVYKIAKSNAFVRDQSFSAYITGVLQENNIPRLNKKAKKSSIQRYYLKAPLDNLTRDEIYGIPKSDIDR